MAIVFKIRRKSDGLFSTGGGYPRFTKIGKLWKQRGHLTNHLNQMTGSDIKRYYDDCEIIQYELIETPIGPSISIQDYFNEIDQRKREREDAERKRREEQDRKKRHEQYLKLKKEFGE